MKKQHIISALVALAAAGCTVSTTGTDEVKSDESEARGTPVKPDGIDSLPAYFDHDNHFAVSDDDVWVYAHFNTYLDKRVTVDLHQRPGAPDASLGFKLYEVLSDGRVLLANRVESVSGAAIHRFKTKGTGSYLVEMVTSGRLADIELNLSCRGSDCSPDAKPGDYCGGIEGRDCSEGLYCNYALDARCGAADRSGTCAIRPQACTKIYAPVCGCDDKTYGNACEAAAAGVSVSSDGACALSVSGEGESCGGFRQGPSPVCADGLYCKYEIGDVCGRADAPGTCARKPDACLDQYDPVCGCDGTTYGNACVAAEKGVSVLQSGPCETGGPN